MSQQANWRVIRDAMERYPDGEVPSVEQFEYAFHEGAKWKEREQTLQEITALGECQSALEELERLRGLCGALYQVCGALDADTRVLDALSAAASGTYYGDGLELLPYPAEAATIVAEPRGRFLMSESLLETSYKVWINEGYVVVRPLPDDPSLVELGTEPGGDSEGWFGKFAVTFGTPLGLRTLAKALNLAADDMEKSDSGVAT